MLSGHALAALQDFYTERDAHTHKFEQLRGAIDVGPEASPADGENSKGNGLSIDAFTEDWNESQFWVCFLVLWVSGGQSSKGSRCEDERGWLVGR